MKCIECNLEFSSINSFNKHVKEEHGFKEYFDKYLISDINNGICKVCGNPTEFIHLSYGYKNCCSKECSKQYTHNQTKKGNLKKYGVENPYQRKEIKRKIKETNNEKYGVDMPLQNKAIKEKAYKTMQKKYIGKTTLESKELIEKKKQTSQNLYGDEKYQNRKQIEKTNIKKYGHINPGANEKVRKRRDKTMIKRYGTKHALLNADSVEKFKNTCLERYGVESPMQNEDLFNKQQISSIQIKYFKNTNLYYQGTYELDFLEKYYDKFDNIKRGPTIKYIFENKNRIYYSDFFIPSLNLVIEIKNSYLYNRDKSRILAKEKAAISNGFNYILIIDKDYTELNNLF